MKRHLAPTILSQSDRIKIFIRYGINKKNAWLNLRNTIV